MRCRFNCQIYYTIYIIFTEFFKLNVWYYNVTHLNEVDYRLLSHISSYLYEIFMELFLSRQNDQIAPVLDTCGWHCVVTPVSKLSTLIGWSKLRACSLMLLKGGFEKGMLVLGDIPLCSQILLMRCR